MEIHNYNFSKRKHRLIKIVLGTKLASIRPHPSWNSSNTEKIELTKDGLLHLKETLTPFMN